jgi:hypothetical protein
MGTILEIRLEKWKWMLDIRLASLRGREREREKKKKERKRKGRREGGRKEGRKLSEPFLEAWRDSYLHKHILLNRTVT